MVMKIMTSLFLSGENCSMPSCQTGCLAVLWGQISAADVLSTQCCHDLLVFLLQAKMLDLKNIYN